MAIVKQWGAAEQLEKKPDQKSTATRHVLVSHVSKVAAVDPLSFFTAGLKKYAGERFFWADSTRGQQYVGLGHAYKIEVSDDKQRFETVGREWKTLLDGASVEPRRTVTGTGPLLFGGFSFDPQADKTELWEAFPDACFILPTFLLTILDGECWLTVNVVTEQWADEETAAQLLQVEANHLLNEARTVDSEWEYIETERKPAIDYTLTDIEADAWKRAVDKAARQIQFGLMDKVALAREIRVDLSQSIDLSHVLKRLDVEQPESYIFAMEQGDACFLGASPEQLVKREGDKLFSVCLASSIGRGETAQEDAQLGQTLLNDARYRIEHEIVVDMIKAAMEAECERVNIPTEPTLFKAKYIQHLYTPVVGYARKGTDLLSMVKKLHPTPALGGYPQKKAVEKIRELELLDRGWYAAPVGWLDQNGDGEFIGAIRSGLIKDQRVTLFVGNGIVGDSDAESEFEETKLKPRPMLSALGGKAK